METQTALDVRKQPTTVDNYQLQAEATSATAEDRDDAEMHARLRMSAEHMIYALEMVIEAGMVMDIVKRYVFYNDQYQYKNLKVHPSSNPISDDKKVRMSDLIRYIHGTSGITTEAGEMAEALLSGIIDGTFDEVNFSEENGDTLWYIAENANAAQESIMGLMVANIRKLQARYPEAFDQKSAVERDEDAERKALEEHPEMD